MGVPRLVAPASAGRHGSLADDDPAEDAIHPASLRGPATADGGRVDARSGGAPGLTPRGGLPASRAPPRPESALASGSGPPCYSQRVPQRGPVSWLEPSPLCAGAGWWPSPVPSRWASRPASGPHRHSQRVPARTMLRRAFAPFARAPTNHSYGSPLPQKTITPSPARSIAPGTSSTPTARRSVAAGDPHRRHAAGQAQAAVRAARRHR